jgi:hypothetical protein
MLHPNKKVHQERKKLDIQEIKNPSKGILQGGCAAGQGEVSSS